MLYKETEHCKQITGLMFAYSLICIRKLWFYANGICMESGNEYIELGKIIDESSYNREKKHIFIDDKISIDYFKNGIVYEVKKSKAIKEVSIYQIKYYLYILKQKGIFNPKGILKIPKEKYSEEILLNIEDEQFIEKQIKIILKIISSNKVPKLDKKKICKKCAYFEICTI